MKIPPKAQPDVYKHSSSTVVFSVSADSNLKEHLSCSVTPVHRGRSFNWSLLRSDDLFEDSSVNPVDFGWVESVKLPFDYPCHSLCGVSIVFALSYVEISISMYIIVSTMSVNLTLI